MYYIKQPSEELLNKVIDAIQVKIIPWDRSFWFDFFRKDTLDLIWYENYKFDYIEDKVVEDFCTEILKRAFEILETGSF